MPFIIAKLPTSNTILQMTAFIANAISVHLSLSPPNPPVKRQDCFTGTPETNTLFEHVVQRVTFLTKVIFFCFGVLLI